MPGSEGHFDLMLFSTGYGKYVDIGFGGFGFIKKTWDIKEMVCHIPKMSIFKWKIYANPKSRAKKS
jgi:hypothetical protein